MATRQAGLDKFRKRKTPTPLTEVGVQICEFVQLGPEPEYDAAFGQIVGGHLHPDAITDGKADEMFPHFAGDMGEDFVIIIELHPEHSAGQDGLYAAFYCDVLFHLNRSFCAGKWPAISENRKK